MHLALGLGFFLSHKKKAGHAGHAPGEALHVRKEILMFIHLIKQPEKDATGNSLCNTVKTKFSKSSEEAEMQVLVS